MLSTCSSSSVELFSYRVARIGIATRPKAQPHGGVYMSRNALAQSTRHVIGWPTTGQAVDQVVERGWQRPDVKQDSMPTQPVESRKVGRFLVTPGEGCSKL